MYILTYSSVMYKLTPYFLLQVAEALGRVTEHRRALEEAEKIEQEFMTLMTGQRQRESERPSRKTSSSHEVRPRT